MIRRPVSAALLTLLLGAAPVWSATVRFNWEATAIRGTGANPIVVVPGTYAPGLSVSGPQTLTLSAPSLLAAPAPLVAPALAPAAFQAQSWLQTPAGVYVPSTLAPASAMAEGISAQKAIQSSALPLEAQFSAIFDGRRVPSAAVGVPAAPAPPGAGRASETDGLAGKALFEKLHETSGRNYKAHDYDAARHYMFSKADNVTLHGVRGVIDAYSGIFVAGTSENGGDYPERGDQNNDGWNDRDGMNTEHIWPQSFFDKRLPMRSDLHHLMTTFIHPNGVRGHMPFGEVRGQGDYSNAAGAKRGQGVFEPPDAVKGRVARAMLYFYTRHYDKNITNGGFGDNFWNSKLEMFLRWNKAFPPTEFEKTRNDLVEQFQGNRNPFTDDPTLADRIGLEGFSRQQRSLSLRQASRSRDRR